MFQTRMQLTPPNSPGTIDLIQGVRSKLWAIFENRFTVNLFTEYEPSQREISKLSIGVISAQYSDVSDLAKIFYGWLIETMKIESLRMALTSLGGKVDKNFRQIKLIENILIEKGIDPLQARSMTAPLAGLNELRISSAHIGSFAMETSFQLLGVQKLPARPRDGWFACVDAVIASLHSIRDTL